MTLAVRFLTGPNATVSHPSGRSYVANGNGIIDVEAQFADSIDARRLIIIGTTADRPVNDPNRIGWPPREMYDTTLGKPIFLVPDSNPARWVDITGSTV